MDGQPRPLGAAVELLAGASGFLLKHAPPEEILLAVRAAIARSLAIGEATAKTHVTRILTKLQLRDRAHAVIYGYETGLVRPGEGRAHETRPSAREDPSEVHGE